MTARNNLDLSAYLVIGPENTLGRPVAPIVAGAVKAGFTCVQIRSKSASARELIELSRSAAAAIAESGGTGRVALLIDDRLDVALAARSLGIAVDGVHVGQSDIPADICRRYLGPDAIIGLSARTHELFDSVTDADISCIDYFGVGPLHATPTKPDCGLDADGSIATRSLAEISQSAKCCPVPIVVGGGVKAADLPALARTGAAGFFVVSAVAGADVPESAASVLIKAWRSGKANA